MRKKTVAFIYINTPYCENWKLRWQIWGAIVHIVIYKYIQPTVFDTIQQKLGENLNLQVDNYYYNLDMK